MLASTGQSSRRERPLLACPDLQQHTVACKTCLAKAAGCASARLRFPGSSCGWLLQGMSQALGSSSHVKFERQRRLTRGVPELDALPGAPARAVCAAWRPRAACVRAASYSRPAAARKLRRGLALGGSSTCSQESAAGLYASNSSACVCSRQGGTTLQG